MNSLQTRAEAFFLRIIAWRLPVVLVGLLAVIAAGAFLPQLEKDTGADSFIDEDNPALIYREKVESLFGLKDPIVVAVVNDGPQGIYNPQSLALVAWLTERLQRTDNIDPERVTSLATESNVVGTIDGMVVERFFEADTEAFQAAPGTQARADEIRAAIADFPLYQGSLVARDGSATIVVAELMDDRQGPATYDAVRDLVADAPAGPGDRLHVAGEGAIAGYLATYIDRDARRLNPIAGIVITLILVLAFFSLRGALLPNLVVLGTVVGTFGVMAATGVSFYVITNGLIVNLIGIAVADSIHILSQYYEELRDDPDADQRRLVARAMARMWRPVTLTTLTTAAGFLALGVAASMPPVRFFGLFGALGLVIAWAYSMTVLPALLSWWPKRLSRPFARTAQSDADGPSRVMTAFGRAVLAHPRAVVATAAVVAFAGVAGLVQVEVNDSRIENFKSSEPIYRADKAINRHMDGTYHLDVMIETTARDALHDPALLRRIEALQAYLETLPHVGGTTSVVDIIKQMHKAVNENREAAHRIPDDPFLVAQLFLLYQASGDPTDLEEEIDAEHRRALVRANLDTSNYHNNKVLVPAVQRYLDEQFNTGAITGTVTGRVNVDYAWIDGIASNHARGVLLSFAAVLLMACLVFRSLTAGLLAALPVGLAVLLVYAVMGFGGIWLGVGTSMFAAIAIGLGVDFAIHTVDRIRDLVARHGFNDAALLRMYPSTGRALLFNFVAVALGFGVLLTSDVPPLVKFGALVAVAVSTAFLGAMTVVPALVKLLRPAFVLPTQSEDPVMSPQDDTARSTGYPAQQGAAHHTAASEGAAASSPGRAPAPFTGRGSRLMLLSATLLGLAAPAAVEAETLPEGRDLIAQVNARDEGECVSQDMQLALTDRSGTTREQQVRSFRCYFGAEKRTVLFYTDPTNIAGTGFLTYDYPDPEADDDQWLYLPALRKNRRISAADRGDYFLGTDFTYEEIKKRNKVEISDYRYRTLGTEEFDGHSTFVVEGTPVSEDIAAELGYSKVVWRIDPEIAMSRKNDYWDINGNHLKTIENRRIEQIDGIWTAVEIVATNHKTGHATRMTLSRVDYEAEVPEHMFRQQMLRRGL